MSGLNSSMLETIDFKGKIVEELNYLWNLNAAVHPDFQLLDRDVFACVMVAVLLKGGRVRMRSKKRKMIVELTGSYSRSPMFLVATCIATEAALEAQRRGSSTAEILKYADDPANWRQPSPLPSGALAELVRHTQSTISERFPEVGSMDIELFWHMIVPFLLHHGLIQSLA